MSQSNHYDQLIAKLDRFTRKYYVSQVIRGLLYTIGLVLALFLTVSLLESQFFFETGTRKMMFYGFLSLSIAAFAGWVLLPLGRYFHLGDVISHDKAAAMIGSHFTSVKDKLLNVLQLRRQASASGDTSLVLASIDQKASEISPVPFPAAIDPLVLPPGVVDAAVVFVPLRHLVEPFPVASDPLVVLLVLPLVVGWGRVFCAPVVERCGVELWFQLVLCAWCACGALLGHRTVG